MDAEIPLENAYFDYCPWDFDRRASPAQKAAQAVHQKRLAEAGADVAEHCYISPAAGVFPDVLRLGARSYIAGQAYVTGEVTAGSDCTVNPYATVRGRISLGDGVRIGAHSSLLGFNHGFAPDQAVHQQPLTSKGITIGDDVWIGSQVVVLDGVTIGDHCVVGAGAVVTRDLPPWTIAAGNPARPLRDRRTPGSGPGGAAGGVAGGVDPRGGDLRDGEPRARDPRDGDTRDGDPRVGDVRGGGLLGVDSRDGELPVGNRRGGDLRGGGPRGAAPPTDLLSVGDAREGDLRGVDLADAVALFADRAREQAAGLLARCWNADTGRYGDRPDAPATVRAHCDAIEIADLLLGSPPPQLPAAEHAERLRALQDPASGLVPEFDADGNPGVLPATAAGDGWIDDGTAEYHVLSVGYALDLLGVRPAHPIHVVGRMTADQLIARLASLPWQTRAWSAGAWVDCWATGAHRNLELGVEAGAPGTLEALFGWLTTRVDPVTGMWGAESPATGRLQPVNGYYRLTRGSFAQFGLPVPYPERVVDAVLAHGRDPRWFAAGRENACNVLDVAHPLWLASRQTGHRAAEVQAWAVEQLTRAPARWTDGAGFGFGPAGEGGAGPGREPGLQGTEMWLAIIWLLADLVGVADRLGYRPRGVHRPEPARAARFESLRQASVAVRQARLP
ncbi:acyltransferase [Streptomyces sp. NPDC087903]|uniref:acyltransferase n=1 Tax=Streptomyces sp. NPDC087903 TaxID=3365819 RepID=UPI003806532F